MGKNKGEMSAVVKAATGKGAPDEADKGPSTITIAVTKKK